MGLGQIVALMMVNKCMRFMIFASVLLKLKPRLKFVCHDNDIICISTHKRFCMSVKGHTFVNKHCRVLILSQSVALMMVNKCMKFHEICFSTFKVKAKVMA